MIDAFEISRSDSVNILPTSGIKDAVREVDVRVGGREKGGESEGDARAAADHAARSRRTVLGAVSFVHLSGFLSANALY